MTFPDEVVVFRGSSGVARGAKHAGSRGWIVAARASVRTGSHTVPTQHTPSGCECTGQPR